MVWAKWCLCKEIHKNIKTEQSGVGMDFIFVDFINVKTLVNHSQYEKSPKGLYVKFVSDSLAFTYRISSVIRRGFFLPKQSKSSRSVL